MVANGENAAGGIGITPSVAEELFQAGIDGLTLGNHVWDKKEMIAHFGRFEQIARPANFPAGVPGRGWIQLASENGLTLIVVNLIGRVYMGVHTRCPFRTFDEIYEEVRHVSPFILVDFHGEATSEKEAFSWYVDGKASAVVGTHTHVQTNDARILHQGTGYMTDVGMTGPRDSVLGMEKSSVIQKFLTQMPQPFRVASGARQINAVLISMRKTDGKCINIKSIRLDDEGI